MKPDRIPPLALLGIVGDLAREIVPRLADRRLHIRVRDPSESVAGLYLADEADAEHVLDVRVLAIGIAIYKVHPEPAEEDESGSLWAEDDLDALEALAAQFPGAESWVRAIEAREKRHIRLPPAWLGDPVLRAQAVERAVDTIEVFIRPLPELRLCPGRNGPHLHSVKARWAGDLCWWCATASEARPGTGTCPNDTN